MNVQKKEGGVTGKKEREKREGSMKVTCEMSGRPENPRGKLEGNQVSIKSRTGTRIP